MTTSGKGVDKARITARLLRLISDMPIGQQEVLLQELEERFFVDRRKFRRKAYFKEVDFAVEDRAYQEFIRDISAGGLFIETRSPMAVGQDITLILSFPKHERPIKIVGEIIRATQGGIGVKFKPADPNVEAMIETLVEEM